MKRPSYYSMYCRWLIFVNVMCVSVCVSLSVLSPECLSFFQTLCRDVGENEAKGERRCTGEEAGSLFQFIIFQPDVLAL